MVVVFKNLKELILMDNMYSYKNNEIYVPQRFIHTQYYKLQVSKILHKNYLTDELNDKW